MFRNLFVKNLKILIVSKEIIFWSLVFPLILATFFYIALNNSYESEKFQTIDVGVVYEQQNSVFETAISGAGDMFSVNVADAEQSIKLLKEGKVSAVIAVKTDSVRLIVSENGEEQSIVKVFVDKFNSVSATVVGIIANGGDLSKIEEIMASVTAETSIFGDSLNKDRNMNPIVVYYFTLIGMACFFFAFAGQNVIELTQPNQSLRAQRVSVGPASRAKVFAATILAHLLVMTVITAIIMFYLMVVLRIDFGRRIGLVLLTAFMGMLLGISFGTLLGTVIRKRRGVKIGITVALTMVLSFLSGMMYVEIKSIINTAVPFIQYINPIGLLCDCFYALYYYQNLTQFALYFALVAGYTAVFAIITILLIRRKKYASI